MSHKIIDELNKQYELLSKDFDVLGVFLCGSQNYGCDTPESDIDTKAIIVPTVDDLIFGKPVSRTIETDVGECDVKDIRQMMAMLKKQNVNYLEILFTDYYRINENYKSKWGLIYAAGEGIARFDQKKAAACILGIFNNEYKRLYKEDDPDVQKYGYRRKSYCNLNRLASAMEKYCTTSGLYSYKTVIDGSKYRDLKKRIFPKGMVDANVEILKRNIERVYYEFNPIDTSQKEASDYLDSIVKSIITKNWRFPDAE